MDADPLFIKCVSNILFQFCFSFDFMGTSAIESLLVVLVFFLYSFCVSYLAERGLLDYRLNILINVLQVKKLFLLYF